MITQIDYQKKTVTFISPGSFIVPENAEKIPFVIPDFVPVIKGHVNGKEMSLALDTGMRGAISIPLSLARKDNFIPSDHPITLSKVETAFAGDIQGIHLKMDTVTLGKSTLKNVAGVAEQVPDDDSQYATLGGGALKHFTLIIDYKHKNIYLIPQT